MTRLAILVMCMGCASASPQLAMPEQDCVDGEVICPAGYEAACPLDAYELESDLGVSLTLTCDRYTVDRPRCRRSYEGHAGDSGSTLPVCVRGDASLVLRGALRQCTLAGEPDVCPAGYVTVCPNGREPQCQYLEGVGTFVRCFEWREDIGSRAPDSPLTHPHCVPG
jgi:hypothetical protein